MKFVSVSAGLCAIAAVSLFSISCEEHHVGEYPEVQRDRLAQSRLSNESGDKAQVSPTPVKFFPERKSP